MRFPIAKFQKLEDGRMVIEGIATTETPDSQGDVLTYDGSKKAFGDWRGNVREAHDPKKPVGKGLEVSFDDNAKAIGVAAIQLPATPGFVTNLKVGRNNYIQSGIIPYVAGAFSASSSFDPGIETLFVQTATSVTTANSATTVLGTGKGSLGIPAGRLMVGSRIRIRASGFVSQADTGTAVKTVVLSLGGVTVATSTSPTFLATLNADWSLDATITLYAVGASGNGYGYFNLNMPGIGSIHANNTTVSGAINTISGVVPANVTYNNGIGPSGVLTTTECSLELLN